MRLFSSRFIAAVCVLAAIVAPVFFGSYSLLVRERDHIVDTYLDGHLDDTRELRGAAHNLLTIAERYLDEAELPTRYELDAADIATLTQRVKRMDLLLRTTSVVISDDDKLQHDRQLANFNSYLDILERSDYTQLAEDYNRRCSSFPANVVASVCGIEPLPIY